MKIEPGDAERLLGDETFQRVLAVMRIQVLEEMVKTNPDNKNEIIYHQAKVSVIDQFRTTLGVLIAVSKENAEEDEFPAAPA